MLPPAEIAKAVYAIVQAHVGIEPDEVIKVAAGLFGFKATSKKLKSAIGTIIDALVEQNLIELRNNRLYGVKQLQLNR